MIEVKAQVLAAMNLPFTISIASIDPQVSQQYLTTSTPLIQGLLQRIEQTYSPFIKTSQVSRYRQGETAILISEPEFQQLYGATQQAQEITDGFFDPFFDGAYNPTGYVKGWAIAQIFNQYLKPLLADPQVIAVGVNGGGDLQLASKDPAQFTWQLGVEQPADLQQLLARYALANGAMATSGTSKRGQHIQRPANADLTQVTVIAAEITTADVWATALMAAPFADAKCLILQHQLSGVLVYHGQRYHFDKGVLADAENL